MNSAARFRPSLGDALKVLIGRSPRMQQMHRLIEKLGNSRWPVLILGETGTGKEVVARSIHQVRSDGPFVTIDCSSMVGPLMESELFGYARGAFTGALNAKAGLFEMANGGTAFLDEIGELPLELQTKLLRVLQEKEFRPVGSLAPKRADFRIIAATNRDLGKEVERGNFRRDLYYRLNVVTLRIAPLRDRREDIPQLIDHFLERYGQGRLLLPEVLENLIRYDWPGNVRELENAIQRMIAVNSGPFLASGDLPSAILNDRLHTPAPSGMRENVATLPSSLPSASSNHFSIHSPDPPCAELDSTAPIQSLSDMEREMIFRALARTHGDRQAAANLLGIGRTTLYRKLKEYEFEEASSNAATA